MPRSRRERDTKKDSRPFDHAQGDPERKPKGRRGRFNFGWNWRQYSLRFLNDERLAAATTSLEELIGAERIRGRSFLDIGCGTGIFSIAASRLGAARVVGFDVDETCVEVARLNAERFCGRGPRPEFFVASILSDEISSLGRFDVVYAWGSLHHTGDMARAIDAASDLVLRPALPSPRPLSGEPQDDPEHGRRVVAPRALLVLGIYNRHFTSPMWRQVKRLFNALPAGAQDLMVFLFAAAFFCAKFLYTFRHPLHKRRGMSFFFDVVDWLGGYPYEYASREEIESHLLRRGFQLEKFVPAPVPTGCNEFVATRQLAGGPSKSPPAGENMSSPPRRPPALPAGRRAGGQ